jgi:hypothetical protein
VEEDEMAEPDRVALALVIQPRRQIVRDAWANRGPVLVALGVLLAYILMSSALIASLENWSVPHAAYFTVINVTTVGFGDVTAASRSGKLLAGVNSFAGLVLFGVLVALITLAFQPSQYTGTAAPVGASTPETVARPHEAPPDRVVADLLTSVGRLLALNGAAREGRIRVAVHGVERPGAHVFVEILVGRGGDA